MFAHERQNVILKMLEQNGSVTTKELVEDFDVSIETIRRDLLYMEQKGVLHRVHGGAVKVGEMRDFPDLPTRLTKNSDKKRELCRIALGLINPGDVIAIDAGSTAVILANEVKNNFNDLTVVTHSLDVFNIISSNPNMKPILCGGHFYPNENSFCGPLCIETMSKLSVQKAFIFPSALSLRYGVCDRQPEMVILQQVMMRSASDVYFLADSSKFECRELIKIDEMSEKYTYVTDSGLLMSLKNTYIKNNIKIITGRDDLK